MNGPWLILILLVLVQAALSMRVARKHPEHRVLSLWFIWMPFSQFLQYVIAKPLIRGPGASADPIAMIAKEADRLLFLSFYAGMIACALYYFARKRPWPALLGLAATAVLMPIWKYALHFRMLTFLRIATIGSTALLWALILNGLLRRRDVSPGLAHLILMGYAAVEVAELLVPVARNFYFNYHVTIYANIVLVTASCAAHTYWLWRERTTPSPYVN